MKLGRILSVLMLSALGGFIDQATAQVVDVYQAEKAVLSEGCYFGKNHSGFSGEGFVEGFFENSKSKITFEVTPKKAWMQPITFRYAAGFGDARMKLTVNGQGRKLIFPSTSGWKNWRLFTTDVVLWPGKQNKIELQMLGKAKNCINLDYFAVGKVKAPADQYITLKPKKLSQAEVDERVSVLNKGTGINEMVVVVRNFIKSSHNYTYFNEGFKPGGGLYLFGKNGFKQLVDSKEGQILDAELSYDGKTVLFSWRKDRKVNYDLYTVNVDGTDLKQLTKHAAHDFNASWLPDGGIVFLSDRNNNFAYCMGSSSAVLYRMELDGSELKRLSSNYLSDIAPHVMHDGKIIYCRWEYVDRFQIPSQGLWAQNPDGTGLMHIYGGRMLDPVTISEAKSIPGTNKIIATLTGHNNSICGGIGIIDPSKGVNNIEGTKEILGEMVRMKGQSKRKMNQKYEFPYPVNEHFFLVSNDGSIEISNYEGKEVSTLLNQGEGPASGSLGFYAALPVQVRQKEPVIESSLPEEPVEKTAKLIMQDVYIGMEKDIAAGILKRGDIKQIRIVELKGKNNQARQTQRAFCWQFPVVSAGATMEPKRTISTIDVAPDGSAMFEVPAEIPVFFQALDKEGRVIQRMRTFTQFMAGEVQSCTGCHDDRNSATPPNIRRISALQRPIQKLTGPQWNEHKDGFSYVEQVQPIIDKHCADCHNPFKESGGLDLSGDRTDLFNVSYDNLVRATDPNSNPSLPGCWGVDFKHPYVSYIPSFNGLEKKYMAPEYFRPKSWGSYKSKLAHLIRDGHKDKSGEPRVKLSELEKRTIYAWIDYNIPYYQTSHTTFPDKNRGMREIVPEGFDNLLKDVAERRCIECHNEPYNKLGWYTWRDKPKGVSHYTPIKTKPRKIPRDFFLRWEKPELNNFMLAPLAKEHGGTGTCGKAVFKDKNDPDYQKLLRAFDADKKLLSERPRMDMPGAQEVRVRGHSKLYKNFEMP